MTYSEIAREAVPAHSFRYGQNAAVEGIDAPVDVWLVATSCAFFTTRTEHTASLCASFCHGRGAERAASSPQAEGGRSGYHNHPQQPRGPL